MADQVKCPKCGSTQISANKKGFSGTKAVAGAVVAGPLGLVAGTHGSGKVRITCLNCGKEFNPGDAPAKTYPLTTTNIILWLITLGCILGFIYLIISNWE